MEFAYIAFTDDCAFGLDDDGICRAVSAKSGASAELLEKARRCIGAQYMASLDASVEGLLSKLPTPGTRLLFARTEADGRIVLMRTAALERFVPQDDVMSTSQLPTIRELDLERRLDLDPDLDLDRGSEDPTGLFVRSRPLEPHSEKVVISDKAVTEETVVVDEHAAVTRRSPVIRAVRRTPLPPVAPPSSGLRASAPSAPQSSAPVLLLRRRGTA